MAILSDLPPFCNEALSNHCPKPFTAADRVSHSREVLSTSVESTPQHPRSAFDIRRNPAPTPQKCFRRSSEVHPHTREALSTIVETPPQHARSAFDVRRKYTPTLRNHLCRSSEALPRYWKTLSPIVEAYSRLLSLLRYHVDEHGHILNIDVTIDIQVSRHPEVHRRSCNLRWRISIGLKSKAKHLSQTVAFCHIRLSNTYIYLKM